MKDQLLIQKLNDSIQEKDPFEVIAEIQMEYKNDVVFTSSLGIEDQVVLDLLIKNKYDFKLITLDTGRLYNETYNLIEKSERVLKKKFEIYFPHFETLESFIKEKGINSFYDSIENRKECCRIRKILPLGRALHRAKFWVTGLRREQDLSRSEIQFAEWDEKFNLIKLNPLLNWTEEKVWNHIKINNIPYNPLHDQGFPSIGCAPCTRAILPGESIRAGRWWWENQNQKECGLHTKE
ncbi:MAG: phosphoadenylyl-sulfate reductase [Leptospiraceae bacterium]|nr:phosphoadenylyl-sulfate reductase [Leptospiraceae bacterium]MCP5512214.1 phosphoadenylyl-sulfate reductase [Leptospiraceae bacterium]